MEEYLAEARNLAQLDHPNIVPVFDVGRTADGLCYIVSKLVEGSDLAARIRQGPTPCLQAAKLVAAVAEALHYAHGHGLVHRDVKPANILIDPAGKPIVMDFGLALKDEDFGRLPLVAGTPAYMSPEQARGEGHRVDGRSDVFSLGVVFYELLTGRRPFRGDTVNEILTQVTGLDVRPPRQFIDSIPRELERICLKEAGGTQGVGVTFLEETFSALTAPPEHRLHQAATRGVLRALLPERGTDIKGQMRSDPELREASGYANRPQEFKDLVRILDTELRLITPVEHDGIAGRGDRAGPDGAETAGVRHYQLTHDYLVRPLRDWLTRKQRETRRGRAELKLEERASLWSSRPEKRYLPSLGEWATIRVLTEKKGWSAQERLMVTRIARDESRPAAIRLRARLAIAPYEEQSAASLLDDLPAASPQQVRIISGRLDRWKNRLYPRLWSMLADPDLSLDAKRRFACSLAHGEPDNPQWTEVAKGVADALLAEKDPLFFTGWVEQLDPVRRVLVDPLARACLDRGRSREQRMLTTAALAELGREKRERVAEVLLAGDDQQGDILSRLVVRDREHFGPLMRAVLAESAAPDTGMLRSNRVANAALTLARLGQCELVWPLLRQSPNPAVRTQLVHRLHRAAATPGSLVDRIPVEQDPSVRQAILLALGGYTDERLANPERAAIVAECRRLYVADPDAGVHSAAEWLLRKSGRNSALGELQQELMGKPPTGNWYINQFVAGGTPQTEPVGALRRAREQSRMVPESGERDRRRQGCDRCS